LPARTVPYYIAVDLPGSGRSEPQPRSYAAGYYHDDARALLGLLDALGISVAHLAGFSDGGEVAVLMAGPRPGLALSLFTWGAAGKIETTPDELTSLQNAVDQPTDGLAPLAAYLATAYGADSARIMIRSWAQAMRDLVAAGGDISRNSAHLITCPALLVPDLGWRTRQSLSSSELRHVIGQAVVRLSLVVMCQMAVDELPVPSVSRQEPGLGRLQDLSDPLV
jgi:pimeloyl-ACP methyl ester carboxylesterase